MELNRRCVYSFVIVLCLPGAALGRHVSPSYAKRVPIEELRNLAAERDYEAILALGLRGDRRSIPLLKKLAGTSSFDPSEIRAKRKLNSREFAQQLKVYGPQWSDAYLHASFAAKAALMRMKAADHLNEFIVELSTTNDTWKMDIVDYLGYAGDQRAIKYLGPLLKIDTCTSSQPAMAPGAVGGITGCKAMGPVAAVALGRILQPPFMEIQKKEPNKMHFFYDEWRQWWEENKGKYQ